MRLGSGLRGHLRRHLEIAEDPAHARGVSCLFLDDPAVFLAGHDTGQENLARHVHCQFQLPFDLTVAVAAGAGACMLGANPGPGMTAPAPGWPTAPWLWAMLAARAWLSMARAAAHGGKLTRGGSNPKKGSSTRPKRGGG